MQTYTIYADWRSASAVSEDTLRSISGSFRPADESVCVYLGEGHENVLTVVAEVEAEGFEEAMAEGRAYITEAAGLGALPGAAKRVYACTDEGYAEWIADGT